MFSPAFLSKTPVHLQIPDEGITGTDDTEDDPQTKNTMVSSDVVLKKEREREKITILVKFFIK